MVTIVTFKPNKTEVTFKPDKKTEKVSELRSCKLAGHYSLYEGPKRHQAAREIDRAVGRAIKAIKSSRADRELLLLVKIALTKHVKPVLDKWDDLGSHDTEPEFDVADVVLDELKKLWGGEFDFDHWDLRGAL